MIFIAGSLIIVTLIVAALIQTARNFNEWIRRIF
jgi:hypothetical protein